MWIDVCLKMKRLNVEWNDLIAVFGGGPGEKKSHLRTKFISTEV